jgi:hypothetical protein
LLELEFGRETRLRIDPGDGYGDPALKLLQKHRHRVASMLESRLKEACSLSKISLQSPCHELNVGAGFPAGPKIVRPILCLTGIYQGNK